MLMDKVESVMREVAEAKVLPRFRSLDAADIEAKTGPQDLVTVADRQAEEMLIPALEALVPGSKVVGEEGVSAGTASTAWLESDGPVWLVDPVDGTYNFVQGSERFGMMVALCQGGVVRQGWILFPVDGRCARAELGAGAEFGGQRITAKLIKPWAETTGDYSHTYVEEPYRSAFLQSTDRAASVRQGRCSAYAYTDLARGELDFVLQYQMTPWDHAPGQLLVEESGGRFGFLPDGDPYTPVAREGRPMLATAAFDAWTTYERELRF